LRINPICSLGFAHSEKDNYLDPHRVIKIIDDLILNAPDIPNSYRFMTSVGVPSREKCLNLYRFLENKTDPRSLRIKSLLNKLLRREVK
jgi:hypothetical protein